MFVANNSVDEEIVEEIPKSPGRKEYDLFDPFSGEKVQARKKVMCRLDVRLFIYLLLG